MRSSERPLLSSAAQAALPATSNGDPERYRLALFFKADQSRMGDIPALLKLLTSRASLPLAVAMKATKSLVPNHATVAALGALSADDLVKLGLEPAVAKKIAKALGKPATTVSPSKGKRKAGAIVAGGDGAEGSGSTADPSAAGAPRPPPPKKPRVKKVYRDPFEIASEQAEALSGEKPYPALVFGVDLSVGVSDHRLLSRSAAPATDGPLSTLDTVGTAWPCRQDQSCAGHDCLGARLLSPTRLQRAGGALVGCVAPSRTSPVDPSADLCYLLAAHSFTDVSPHSSKEPAFLPDRLPSSSTPRQRPSLSASSRDLVRARRARPSSAGERTTAGSSRTSF